MGLVGRVIKDKVRDIRGIGIFTYEDLFQIGCVGLVKAADTYMPGPVRFSTYAYRLIRNEIFDALDYATVRRNRESVTCPDELPVRVAEDFPGIPLGDLQRKLDVAQAEATGVTQKGVMAIRMLAEGYTHREIGELMDATANNVSAWVARARKYLRTRPEFAVLEGD
jgi:RNA polymerase sigma factor (sigma-70 family)